MIFTKVKKAGKLAEQLEEIMEFVDRVNGLPSEDVTLTIESWNPIKIQKAVFSRFLLGLRDTYEGNIKRFLDEAVQK